MTDTPEAVQEDRTFEGYGPAADYLGLQRNTLSSYVTRGIGPAVAKDGKGEEIRVVRGQYVLPVFRQSELDRWRAERPGQGARTDLATAAA